MPSEPAPANAPELNIIQPDELLALPLSDLLTRAGELGLRVHPDRNRHQFVFDLLKRYAERGFAIRAEGILELTGENYGFLRSPKFNFNASPKDAYVSPGLVKKFGLKTGNLVGGNLRAPRDREKFMALDRLLTIEGTPVENWQEPVKFDDLTALFPTERIILENTTAGSMSARAVDLIAPLGRGQRALIVAPPRAGKTILLKHIAQAIQANSPDSHVIMLLIDERPEEVTDLKREVNAEVFSSTFDESPTRHVHVAEMVSERAKRLVEQRRHVIILLDSITRLARGYNALQPAKGRIMSGGVDAKALMKPKRFFGSARNVEEGGSLTIIGTALVQTESRMDEVIFEEFKGTGNMELHLDREIAERRIYPAIHVLNSGTRRDELLYHPDEFERVQILRKSLAALPAGEAMEVLLNNLKATKTNTELLLTGLR